MRIYADYNASAPLRPEARAALVEASTWTGNPSSAHREGARQRRALEEARAAVAALVEAVPAAVVFTSGATEANALALAGTLERGDRLVTTAVEHASVLAWARTLEERGVQVHTLGVAGDGTIDPDAVARSAAGGVQMASIGLANGETGVVTSAAVLAAARRDARVLHVDAAQAVGRLDVDWRGLDADLVSISAHKLGGPMGVGALVVRPGTPVRALLRGGGQERGRRAGTENVPAIVAFGAAARAVRAALAREPGRLAGLRDALWDRLRGTVPGIVRNGATLDATLPNTLNVTVPGVSGDAMLVLLDLAGVAVSLGSACSAGSAEPSHVLLAMGCEAAHARCGLRLSLGDRTTAEDVRRIADAVARAAEQARAGAAA